MKFKFVVLREMPAQQDMSCDEQWGKTEKKKPPSDRACHPAFCPHWPAGRQSQVRGREEEEEDGDDASVTHCDWLIILTIDKALPLSLRPRLYGLSAAQEYKAHILNTSISHYIPNKINKPCHCLVSFSKRVYAYLPAGLADWKRCE